jgi:hypothetical protein
VAQIQEAVGKWVDELKGTVPDFTGRLRKIDITLPGVKTRPVNYVKRGDAEYRTLRGTFNSSARGKFLRELASDPDKLSQLKAAGLTNTEINLIAAGRVPEGWQVHHKLPLDDNGTNDFSNLILMKNDPYHMTVTNFQNDVTAALKEGEMMRIDWPIPDGFVYPPG